MTVHVAVIGAYGSAGVANDRDVDRHGSVPSPVRTVKYPSATTAC